MNDQLGIIRTYKLTASEYIAKHDPCYLGRNEVGVWYEHPLFGDEAGLLVATVDNKIHGTIWEDVPAVASNGDLY